MTLTNILHSKTNKSSLQDFTVPEGKSIKNIFSNLSVPRNPGLGPNNWSSPHQDSYCTESVGLCGPTSEKLQLILQQNPYGFTPVMVSNQNNQMIGIALNEHLMFHLIVFDSDCNILSTTRVNDFRPHSFGGGYFYQDHNDNTISNYFDNRLASFPTSNVENRRTPYKLTPNWISDDIVKLVTHSSSVTSSNRLYSVMPVWDKSNLNLYWCLLAGNYTIDDEPPVLKEPAYMAVVEIVPDANAKEGARTKLMDSYELTNQWNNNTFAVDKDGAYFVTNGVNDSGASTGGYCWALSYSAGKISLRWQSSYENSGLLKPGQKNIGSGTTPTLLTAADGTECVAITDNAYPQMNVVVYNRSNGTILKQTPVFPAMRGCDEASLIGISNRLVVENNFGHTVTNKKSQLVTNEPGLAMLTITDKNSDSRELAVATSSEIIWEDKRNAFFAMSMLARESGIIFAHTADWSDDISATQGAMYYISAIDSWDGRVIWRIPLGRGYEFCHDYGGIYFNRSNGIFMGTRNYLVSIRNAETQ
ncbi:MAG: hypothetical protein QNJ55_36630 [Xenococcus sp. MO_188.B8]|nr:hypothetical protein [Xenococcus sp. MO_188.B8]